MKRNTRKMIRQTASLLAIAAATAMAVAPAHADPVAGSGYSIRLFAGGPAGTSAADSVLVVGNDVYVGYGNGGNPDGSGGAVSTIMEFSRSGQVLASTMVTGHNDGLRYDAATKQIWALQNEDANANLVLVTPGTLAKSAAIPIASVNGGGYDDIVFQGGKTFISASNPAKSQNTDPAIVQATLSGGAVTTTPALTGNASATLFNTNSSVTLNLQDPDSVSQTIDGRAVLTSQADGELVFVSNLGASNKSVGALALQNAKVDDTAFGGTPGMTLLVADKSTNDIYAVTGTFNPNFGYSAAQNSAGTTGFIGAFDASSAALPGFDGALNQIVTGLGNPGGEAFIAGVPEFSTWGMMMLGFVGLGFAGHRRMRLFRPAAAKA
jgi:hypothetical protein